MRSSRGDFGDVATSVCLVASQLILLAILTGYREATGRLRGKLKSQPHQSCPFDQAMRWQAVTHTQLVNLPRISRSLSPCRVGGQPVCSSAYRAINCIGNDVLSQLRRKVKELEYVEVSTSRKEGESSNAPIFPGQRTFHAAFSEVIDLFGETMPHLSRKAADGSDVPYILLPSALYPTKQDVYQELMDLGQLSSDFKLKYFLKLWRRYFHNVSLKSWNPFAKCDVCVKFRNRLLSTPKGNTVALHKLKADQCLHREYVSYARKRLKARETLMDQNPDQVLFIIFDKMDSSKVAVPRLRSDALFSKDLSNEGDVLQSKLLGFLIPGNTTGFLNFWLTPQYKQGASHTATLLLSTLHKVRPCMIIMLVFLSCLFA